MRRDMKQIQKPFSIYFVCRGNTYRSRLAAAYMAGVLDDRFVVSSSGIATHHARTQTSELYTKLVAEANGLDYQIHSHKTQTTSELLTAADVIIFMNKDVYDEAVQTYRFDTRKAQVWQVADVDPELKAHLLASHRQQDLADIAAHTFKKIRRLCNELQAYLTATAWTDVVEADNSDTGLRLPVNWVSDRGLWHRGIHVVVRTADGKFVVGKRVREIVFAPGMLEISVGGGLDAGETPRYAAARETHEELGVLLPETSFQPLFMFRQHSYHPHYKKYSRAHLYVYSVTLPVHSAHLRPQPGEVDELRVLSKRQVMHMLRTHRVTNFGQLKWDYKLYQQAVARSLQLA